MVFCTSCGSINKNLILKNIFNDYTENDSRYIINLKNHELTYHDLYQFNIETFNTLIQTESLPILFTYIKDNNISQENEEIKVNSLIKSNDYLIKDHITYLLYKTFKQSYLNINKQQLIMYYNDIFDKFYIKYSKDEFIEFNKEFVDLFVNKIQININKIYQKQEIIDILPYININKCEYDFCDLYKNLLITYNNIY